MSAGDLNGAPPPLRRPFRGFSSYADDTPRDLEDNPQQAEPFEDVPFEPAHDDLRFAAPDDREPPPPRPRRFGAVAAAGVVVAILGVGTGLMLVRSGSTVPPPPPPPETPLTAQAPAAADVEVAAVPQAPLPKESVVEGPARPDPTAAIEPPQSRSGPVTRAVRPAQLSPLAQRPPAEPIVTPSPRVATAPPPPRFVDEGASSPAAAQAPAPAPAPALAEAAPAPPPIRASFDCREARTPSQQMVCSDPRLAEADRRMSRAYEAAVAAGAPQEELRAEQADWLEIREDAARRSKRAVMNIYEQRTEELEALAAQGPG